MKIEPKQMEVFSKESSRRFEDRMLNHVRRLFPGKCKEFGEDQVRAWIRDGVERARGYDIVVERDVCKYIDLMFTIGREFDRDGVHRWARDILTDDAYPDGTARVNRLCEEAAASARKGP